MDKRKKAFIFAGFATIPALPLALLLWKAAAHITSKAAASGVTLLLIVVIFLGALAFFTEVVIKERWRPVSFFGVFVAQLFICFSTGWLIQASSPQLSHFAAGHFLIEVIKNGISYDRDVMIVENAIRHPDSKTAKLIQDWKNAGAPTTHKAIASLAEEIRGYSITRFNSSTFRAIENYNYQWLEAAVAADRSEPFPFGKIGPRPCFDGLLTNCKYDKAEDEALQKEVAAILSAADESAKKQS